MRSRLAVYSMLFLMPVGVAAAPRRLDFAAGGWDLEGDARFVRQGERNVLEIETGTAHFRNLEFQDGTIDFDVQLTRRRSFVYLMFRMESDRDYEEVYLRPHKSDLPDAVQYAPVWQGQSAWQLHRGPGGTAAVGFSTEWTHVRLVIRDQRAALFVGDMEKPALFVPRLSRPPKSGYIAARAFLPKDTPGAGPVARYADLVVRPGEYAFDLSALPAAPAQEGPPVIGRWALSKAYSPDAGGGASIPEAVLDAPFSAVDAEPDGLVQLDRYVTRAAGPGGSALAARLHLVAGEARTCAVDLGWSDTALVFLDRRPIFRGIDSYSFALGRDGVISFDQGRLFLPLHAGDNELLVAVSDGFGGAGLMGRLVDCPGVNVEAR